MLVLLFLFSTLFLNGQQLEISKKKLEKAQELSQSLIHSFSNFYEGTVCSAFINILARGIKRSISAELAYSMLEDKENNAIEKVKKVLRSDSFYKDIFKTWQIFEDNTKSLIKPLEKKFNAQLQQLKPMDREALEKTTYQAISVLYKRNMITPIKKILRVAGCSPHVNR